MSRRYRVLPALSLKTPKGRRYPRPEGRLLMHYSPFRHSSFSRSFILTVRLACLIHAASVRSEPGSNPLGYSYKQVWVERCKIVAPSPDLCHRSGSHVPVPVRRPSRAAISHRPAVQVFKERYRQGSNGLTIEAPHDIDKPRPVNTFSKKRR